MERFYAKMVGMTAHIYDAQSRYQPVMIVNDLAYADEVLDWLKCKETYLEDVRNSNGLEE